MEVLGAWQCATFLLDPQLTTYIHNMAPYRFRKIRGKAEGVTLYLRLVYCHLFNHETYRKIKCQVKLQVMSFQLKERIY